MGPFLEGTYFVLLWFFFWFFLFYFFSNAFCPGFFIFPVRPIDLKFSGNIRHRSKVCSKLFRRRRRHVGRTSDGKPTKKLCVLKYISEHFKQKQKAKGRRREYINLGPRAAGGPGSRNGPTNQLKKCLRFEDGSTKHFLKRFFCVHVCYLKCETSR